MQLRDYHEQFRSEETLAGETVRLRKAARIENASNFSITTLIRQTVPLLLAKGDILEIELKDALPGNYPAFVEFSKTEGGRIIRLFCQRDVWKDAELGGEESRFVLAHEICHILLHGYSNRAFSRDKASQIKIGYMDEYSGEWQADKFAKLLLAPDHIVEQFLDDPTRLATFCQLELSVAEERVADVRDKVRRRNNRACSGEACTRCGMFTVIQYGISQRCHDCGFAKEL